MDLTRRQFVKGTGGFVAATPSLILPAWFKELFAWGGKEKTAIVIADSPLGIDRMEKITKYLHNREGWSCLRMTATRQWFQSYINHLVRRNQTSSDIVNTLESMSGTVIRDKEMLIKDGWEDISDRSMFYYY